MIKIRVKQSKSMIMTAAMIFVIGLSTIYTVFRIRIIEEEYCFQSLQQSTDTLAENIKELFENDREQLEAIANVIADYGAADCEQTGNLLAAYQAYGMISRLDILLPDNTVLFKDGTRMPAGEELSFQEEAALGAHISDKEEDLCNEECYILRNCVPIVIDGETKAVLCGIIELERLPELLKSGVYGENTALSVIDGNTGDYLVDTTHEELGNIWEAEIGKLKAGYEQEQLINEITEGKSGHVIFTDEASGEYLYHYYTPVGINRWMLTVSVPGSAVFQNAARILNLLYFFIAVEAVCLIAYVIWMFCHVSREKYDKQKQFEMVTFIYDIEKLLFGAHIQKSNISTALQRIAGMTTAEGAFFEIYDDGSGEQIYIWDEDREKEQHIRRKRFFLRESFAQGRESLVINSLEDLRHADPEHYENLEEQGLRNLTAVPVRDTNEKLLGVIGVLNVRRTWNTAELLKNVTLSFSMLCSNMKTFNLIKEMGEKDYLTGLLNRNSFQKKLPFYRQKYKKSIACIYADANGLHELNNEKGHEAGDRMLQCVAASIQSEFGEEDTYRIGGDEFLAFAVDEEEAVIRQKLQKIAEETERREYHVSIGVKWSDSVGRMEDFVKEAETAMFEEKKRYYQQRGKERRGRI